MKYVHFIRDRYEARVTVPPALRGIVGKRELKEPLGGDKKAAERRAHGVIAGFLATIEDARVILEKSKPTLATAAKAHYRAELEADDRERAVPGQKELRDLHAFARPVFASRLRLLAAGQIDADEAEALIGYAADDLTAKGLVPRAALGTHARADILRSLAEVQLDALARFEERDRGIVYPGEPKSELLTMPEPEAVQIVKPKDRGTGKTLSEILPDFHKERTSGNRTLADKTMKEHVVAVRMFEEFAGKIPAKAITRADALDYKRALLETPTRYSLRFPGLSLPQAIKANAKREKPFPTLDPQTINMKWLSHLSTVLKWCANNGVTDDNPASGVRVDEGKGFKEPSRVPFTQDDLKRIFGSSLFADPARYETQQWALLLALYTGARSSSELARVNLSDIREEQDVHVIELTEASKNLRSRRIVPIHRALIDLGFLAYVEKLRSKGKQRLFPDWQPEDKVNRWFLRTYKAEVGINDARKVFHSFRHSLKTELARRAVNRDVSDLITGHKDQSVAAVYIADATFTMIQAMADALNKANFALPMQK